MGRATSASAESSPSLLRVVWILLLALFLLLLHAPRAHADYSLQGTLAWDPVDDPSVAGYKVHYGTASRDYDTTEDIGASTSYPITGLTEGVTYFFAVTAYDTNLLESDYSPELAYKILTANPDGDSLLAGCSGNLPADPNCQQGVSFAFAARQGDYRLSYTAYDITQADQVQILVNGTSYGYVPVTAPGGYSGTVALDLPEDLVSHDAYNIVRFVPAFDPPDALNWGVCNVGLDSRALEVTDSGWYGNLGGVTGGDRDHPDRVQFLLDAPAQIPPEGILLRFRVYDVDLADEIEVTVNGGHLLYAPVTENNSYSDLIELAIPAWMLVAGEANLVTFSNTYNPLNNYVWGVGDLSLVQDCPDCIPLPAAAAYGRITGGDTTHTDHVNYSFPGTAGNVVVACQLWDVDFSGEVEILVNGIHFDYAPMTPSSAWGATEYLLIPDELVLDAEPNVLTFDNLWNPPNTYWWGVRNVSLSEACTDCIALPDTGAYGRITGGDLSHPDEVNYFFEGAPGDLEIVYQVWDVDFANEVQILLNGASLGHAQTTENEAWSSIRSLTLPDALVLDAGLNVLTFSNTYNPPNTYWWGVRNVSLAGACPGSIPLPDPGAYGRIVGGDQSHVEEVNYSFAGTPGPLELAYRVWDADFPDEVEILINGLHLGYAPVTANEAWGAVQYLTIPDGMIFDAGTNVVTFSNTCNPPNTYWWGVSEVSVE